MQPRVWGRGNSFRNVLFPLPLLSFYVLPALIAWTILASASLLGGDRTFFSFLGWKRRGWDLNPR